MMNAYILMWQTERSFMTDGMTGVQAERLTKAYNKKNSQLPKYWEFPPLI